MSISYQPARLALKIKAKNYHAEVSNIFVPRIIDSIRPFLNQKIYLATGARAKKFADAVFVPEYSSKDGRSFNFSLSCPYKNLQVNVRVSMWDGDINVSSDNTFYIGSLDDAHSVLDKIDEFEAQKTDWDYTDIVSKIVDANRKEEIFEAAKRLVPGEFQGYR